jgi:pimeloyl-ACP methyl ester carboxylesterase
MRLKGAHGGTLEVETHGPAEGAPLIVHSGTPGACQLFARSVREGASRGMRHIAYARPGYAGSERQPGRSVADCAADVAAIADALGIERFLTIGFSGGGPHALACAALLPDRVRAAASVAGVAPFDAEGLDWLAGQGQENLDEFAATEAGEEQLLAYLEEQAAAMVSASGDDIHASMGGLLSDVDRGALTGEFAHYLASSTRAALANGVWGWFDDDIAHVSEWDFELGAITRPVTIWQGGQDRFVPPAHGEWLAAHVPGASAQLRPEHGHLSLSLAAYGEILDDLLAHGG